MFLMVFTLPLFGQNPLTSKDEGLIKKALFKQQEDWNRGDIDAFMEGYLESDNIVFNGASGPQYGWREIKERYLSTYPDRAAMGSLTFGISRLYGIEKSIAILVGSFHLQREVGDLEGFFTLVWKKVDGTWYVLSDHTSVKAGE